MTPEEAWADIERVEVDAAVVSAFDREIRHSTVAYNLVRETSSWACVAACVVPRGNGWDRSNAVLAGHSVRLFKLLRSVLEQINQDRAELIWVVLRMASECAINLRYLVTNLSTELVEEYLRYSLQREWALLEEIERNTSARGGLELPIEVRMKRSVLRTFEQSGIDPLTPPKKRIKHWGGLDLKRRAETLGLEDAYRTVFSGPSESVHGNWGDLLRHHLVYKGDGKFAPNLEPATMRRPQPLLAMSKMAAPAIREYLQWLDPAAFAHPVGQMVDLLKRVELADSLHEDYLAKRSPKPLQPTSGAGAAG